MAISEGNEFEHDVRDVLDEIDALKTDLLAKELSIEEFGDKVNRVFAEFLKEYPEEIGDEEWLYSHPTHGGHSTPVPVLIQQDYKILERARQHYYKDKR